METNFPSVPTVPTNQGNNEILLDGKPSLLAEQIRTWTIDATTARDDMINRFYGPRIQSAGNYSGMRALVWSAHRLYCQRGWELPPYNYENLDNDTDRLVYPWFFGNIQRILPLAAPTDIKLRAIPLRGDKKVFAAQANAILEEESKYLHLDRHNQGLVLGAKLYGSQVAYYGARQIRGQFDQQRVAELCDPLSFLWEPGAASTDDAKYLIYQRWILIDDAKRMYRPDFEIQPEDMEAQYSSMILLSGQQKGMSQHRCVEKTVWIADSEEYDEIAIDYQMQEFQLTDVDSNPIADNAGQPVVIQSPVPVEQVMKMLQYPHGRIVTLINNKIVEDTPGADGRYKYNHGRKPFVKMDNYPYPGSFWGIPEGLANGDMPAVINESVSAIVRGARQSVKKIGIEPEQMEDPETDLNNDQTQVIKLKEGAILKGWKQEIDLGGMGPEYAEILGNTIRMSDQITGVNDTVRGVPNSDVTSGVQAQIMTQNATQRTAVFVKQLSEHHSDAGILILNNAVQFRQPDEVVEISSNFGDPKSFQIADFPIDTEFHIKITPYSGLPSDRKERLEQLLAIIPKLLAIFQQSPELSDAIVKLADMPELEEAWLVAKEGLVQRQQQQQADMLAVQGSGQGASQPPIQSQPTVQ
jgi:hypothetical protein